MEWSCVVIRGVLGVNEAISRDGSHVCSTMQGHHKRHSSAVLFSCQQALQCLHLKLRKAKVE
eukprot:2842427-Amphidinium_carterae.1